MAKLPIHGIFKATVCSQWMIQENMSRDCYFSLWFHNISSMTRFIPETGLFLEIFTIFLHNGNGTNLYGWNTEKHTDYEQ